MIHYNNNMHYRQFKLKNNQHGQGVVEYAILLILTITLVIGGIELAATALSSGKASSAAEAATNEYIAINEKRINAQESQQVYLRKLNSLLSDASFNYDQDPLSDVDAPPFRIDSAGSNFSESFISFLDLFSTAAYNYGSMINAEYGVFFDPDNINDDSISNNLYIAYYDVNTIYDDLADVLELMDGVLDDNDDGIIDASDQDGTISIEEVAYAVKFKDTLVIDEDSDGSTEPFNIIKKVSGLNTSFNNNAPTITVQNEAFRILKYKTLILLAQIHLSTLPLDPRTALSESTPLLGDHTPTEMYANPSCLVDGVGGETTYNVGFHGLDLDVDLDGYPDDISHRDLGTAEYPAVFLFNPLAINVASCHGKDPNRGNRSRLSILTAGYGKVGNPYYVKGLPKLHEAYHGQYTRICLDDAEQYVSCGAANVAQELLKPPGKLCLSSVASPSIDSCPDVNEDYLNSAGYYFWGYDNDAVANSKVKSKEWRYNESEAPEFRPTLQLICNDGSEPSPNNGDVASKSLINNAACLFGDLDNPDFPANLQTIRVNVRYRSVFESFLTLGLMTLIDEGGLGLADYFYDPSNLRALTNGQVGIPIAGSELGPKNSHSNPTVKHFKDFRGCYEIDVETNRVSNCN